MKQIDYSNLRIDEIVNRLRTKGRQVSASAIIPLILHEACSISLYKTSLTDPIDAVVELLCKVIPDTPVAELQSRVQCGDKLAMVHLRTCLKYGIGCARKENEYELFQLLEKSMHGLPQAAAAFAEDMRIKASPNPHVYSHRFVMLDKPVSIYEKQIRENMWNLLEYACRADYVCPATILLSGLSYAYHVMHDRDDPCITQVIHEFMIRHSDVSQQVEDILSLLCYHKRCESHVCDPGVVFNCDKCELSFCCDACLKGHKQGRECRPGAVFMPLKQKKAQHPKPFLEHVLGMFGILLPALSPNSRPLSDATQACRLSVRQLKDVTVRADSFAKQGRNLPALRLYTAAIDSFDPLDCTSKPLAELLMKRSKVHSTLGNYESADMDMMRVSNGDFGQIDPELQGDVFGSIFKMMTDTGMTGEQFLTGINPGLLENLNQTFGTSITKDPRDKVNSVKQMDALLKVLNGPAGRELLKIPKSETQTEPEITESATTKRNRRKKERDVRKRVNKLNKTTMKMKMKPRHLHHHHHLLYQQSLKLYLCMTTR